MSHHEIAVTGVGAVTCLGVGVDPLVAGILEPGPATGGPADLGGRFSARENRRLARFTQLAALAAGEALGQAGYADGFDHDPAAVCFIGTGLGGIDRVQESVAGGVPSAFLVPAAMPNAAAADICMRYGIGGPSYALGGACAAGTQAIGAGLAAVRSGAARVAVVGGAEAPLVPVVQDSFAAAGALSPTGSCRPFDASRDGFVMGEGAGVLVLEPLADAQARGAEILGLILGYGASSDAFHLTASPPGAEPAARAMRLALQDAQRRPAELAFVNAHGTGTPLNDEQEVTALCSVLGESLPSVPVMSTKAVTGHLFGGGGAVEAILCLDGLRRRMVPGTRGLQTVDPSFPAALNLPAEPAELTGAAGCAMSSSFGFGGHNAVVVVGSPP